MKVLFHYLREADIIAAISNKTFGAGPLLSIINSFSGINFDKVKCIMSDDDKEIKKRYLFTKGKALYSDEGELYFKLRDGFNNFDKKPRLLITKFFEENIKCDIDFVYIDGPIDNGELHPDIYNQIFESTKDNEVYAIYDSSGDIVSDFSIYEFKENLKIIVNKDNFPNRIPKNFDFSRDIFGTYESSPLAFINKITLIKENESIPKSFEELVTRDPEMISLIKFAEFIAKFDDNVLLLGNTGTGKEVFASAIHKASNRNKEPFIAVNCGAIPRELFEAELFGSVKGGYHGAQDKKGFIEEADGGTLFLDEIGDTHFEHQTKLLRVIQDKKSSRVGSTKLIKSDFRLICATNKNLINYLDITFRSDLYYRINTISLKLPDLRDRNKRDIQKLLEYFVTEEKKNRPGFENISFSNSVINSLKNYPWPGNIRELKGFVQKAFLWAAYLSKDIDEEIMNKCLDLNITERQNTPISNNESSIIENETETIDKYRKLFSVELIDNMNIKELFESINKHYLLEAMKKSKTEKQAGKLLGFSQTKVSKLAKKYGLEI